MVPFPNHYVVVVVVVVVVPTIMWRYLPRLRVRRRRPVNSRRHTHPYD